MTGFNESRTARNQMHSTRNQFIAANPLDPWKANHVEQKGVESNYETFTYKDDIPLANSTSRNPQTDLTS